MRRGRASSRCRRSTGSAPRITRVLAENTPAAAGVDGQGGDEEGVGGHGVGLGGQESRSMVVVLSVGSICIGLDMVVLKQTIRYCQPHAPDDRQARLQLLPPHPAGGPDAGRGAARRHGALLGHRVGGHHAGRHRRGGRRVGRDDLQGLRLQEGRCCARRWTSPSSATPSRSPSSTAPSTSPWARAPSTSASPAAAAMVADDPRALGRHVAGARRGGQRRRGGRRVAASSSSRAGGPRSPERRAHPRSRRRRTARHDGLDPLQPRDVPQARRRTPGSTREEYEAFLVDASKRLAPT